MFKVMAESNGYVWCVSMCRSWLAAHKAAEAARRGYKTPIRIWIIDAADAKN